MAEAGLVVGSGLNLVWDRGLAPGGSPTVTLPIRFDGTGTSSLNAYTLGLRTTGGTSGSLTISNITLPTVNPVFPTPHPTSPTVTSPVAGVTAVAVENNAAGNEAPGESGRNALSFNFTSTNALGIYSLILDNRFSSYFVAPASADNPFANANGTDLVIGQITVTNSSATVPEPAVLGLLVLVPLVGLVRRRQRSTSG